MEWRAARHRVQTRQQGQARGAAGPGAVTPHTGEEMPLDVLTAVMWDKRCRSNFVLPRRQRRLRIFIVRVSTDTPKASFEITALELQTAIAREKEYCFGRMQDNGTSEFWTMPPTIEQQREWLALLEAELDHRIKQAEWDAGQQERGWEQFWNTLAAMGERLRAGFPGGARLAEIAEELVRAKDWACVGELCCPANMASADAEALVINQRIAARLLCAYVRSRT